MRAAHPAGNRSTCTISDHSFSWSFLCPAAQRKGKVINMRDVVIVDIARSAVGKAPKGKLSKTRPEDYGSQVLKGLLAKCPQVPPEDIEDIICGCSFPEAEQGTNIARVLAGRTGLPDSVGGVTINRFCSSGVQSIAMAHSAIASGFYDVIIAGGCESMSCVPGGGNMNFPEPAILASNPGHYYSMGITSELVAEKYHISREKQDKLALRSHQLAEAAQKDGRLNAYIVDVEATRPLEDGSGSEKYIFNRDEGIRYGSTLENLQKLKPVFRIGGSTTAGNSSQTSDGAGFALLMTKEKANAYGLKPIARVRNFATVGVDPKIMGVGPMYAIPKVLKQAGMTFKDLDLIELNEAFASQSLACIEALDVPMEKTNVMGGAIALGHPLGASGAFLTCKLFGELRRNHQQFGMVTMCIGGGMGAGIIYEMLYS